MLNKTKFVMSRQKDWEYSPYMLIENDFASEAVFVVSIDSVKDFNMRTDDEKSVYLEKISWIMKANNINFKAVVSMKHSAAIDYATSIMRLLNSAKNIPIKKSEECIDDLERKQNTENQWKKIIILWQVKMILSKIWEKKWYVKIIISVPYVSHKETMKIYKRDVREFFMLLASGWHNWKVLKWRELVHYFAEYYTTKQWFVTKKKLDNIMNTQEEYKQQKEVVANIEWKDVDKKNKGGIMWMLKKK